MDVADLRVFVAVAEELHFGRAARRLHMTQPPVSRVIRRLETWAGVTLLERSTRRVELTSAGRAFLGPARAAVEAFQRADEVLRAVGLTAPVRLAYPGASVQSLVGRIVRELSAEDPPVQLLLTGSSYGAASLARLTAGEVDFAIGHWEELPAGIVGTPLARESIVLAVREGHPGVRGGAQALGEFADEPFLTLPADSLLVELLHRYAMSSGFTPRQGQVAPDSATLVALAAEGSGVSLTVSSVETGVPAGGVLFVPLEGTEPVALMLVWREGDTSPAGRRLIRAARRLWRLDRSGSGIVAT